MGLSSIFSKITSGVGSAVTAGKVVTALFPDRTKKLDRYLETADKVNDKAVSVSELVFMRVSFSPQTIRDEAALAYKLDLTDEEAGKVFEYLKRNFEQTKQAALGAIADGRR